MAITKRTRYEVLRRDNHACRYCGCMAPEVKLTVDHVVPTALGGSDDPSNLVAACRDCNAGKASTSPDAALVADIKQVDIKWAAAIRRVAAARARQRKKQVAYEDAFLAAWNRWTFGADKWTNDLPGDWRNSLARFYELGVPIVDIKVLVDRSCGNHRVSYDETFRYFCGCVWRLVTEMQEAAKALLEAEAADGA